MIHVRVGLYKLGHTTGQSKMKFWSYMVGATLLDLFIHKKIINLQRDFCFICWQKNQGCLKLMFSQMPREYNSIISLDNYESFQAKI